MKVWLTGEAGAVGKSFTEYCARTRKHEFINSLSNDEYDYWRKTSPIKTNEIDIFDPTLETIISRSEADIIVHCAETHLKSEDYTIKTNILGTYYVAEIAKKLEIPFVYISSPDCYDISEDLLSDQTCIKNNSIYTYSKNSAESLIKLMLDDYRIIVPGYLYGPHDDNGYIARLIKSHFGKSDSVKMNIDPESPKSFLYMDDFMNLLDTVISEEYPRKIKINACYPVYYSYSDVLACLEEQGLSPEFDFSVKKDVVKTRKLLNSNIDWQPSIDLHEGIEKTVEWISKTL